MHQWLWISLTFLLIGCGRQAPIVDPTMPPETAAAAATILAVPTSTREPTTVPTTEPTGTSIVAVFEERHRRAYRNLIYIKAAALYLEEHTLKADPNGCCDSETFTAITGTRAMLFGTDNALRGRPPGPAFATVWERGQRLTPQIHDLIDRWAAEEIDPAYVLDKLPPIQSEIDAMLAQLDGEITMAYGVTPDELQIIHDEVVIDHLGRLRDSMTRQP